MEHSNCSKSLSSLIFTNPTPSKEFMLARFTFFISASRNLTLVLFCFKKFIDSNKHFLAIPLPLIFGDKLIDTSALTSFKSKRTTANLSFVSSSKHIMSILFGLFIVCSNHVWCPSHSTRSVVRNIDLVTSSLRHVKIVLLSSSHARLTLIILNGFLVWFISTCEVHLWACARPFYIR